MKLPTARGRRNATKSSRVVSERPPPGGAPLASVIERRRSLTHSTISKWLVHGPARQWWVGMRPRGRLQLVSRYRLTKALERLGAVRPNPPAPSVKLGRDPARSRKSNLIATRLGIGYGRAYPREEVAMVSCTRAPRFGYAIGSNDCG